MRNILIGIGGTGAKCVEATIYLAAAGVLQGATHIYLVDQDTANALSRRAHELAGLYRRVHKIMKVAGDQPFASTPISMHKEILQPLAEADSNLEVAFQLSKTIRLGNENFDDAVLAQALFTERERCQDMKKGFEARPSIGSAIYTKASIDNNILWSTLAAAVQAGDGTENFGIVLMGSIFGGTGAAGVPTLAQHLKRLYSAHQSGGNRLAAVLMLPYFYIRSNPDSQPSGYGPLNSTQVPSALLYYSEVYKRWKKKENVTLFDGLYLVGLDPMIGVADDHVGGGAGQTNAPSVPELVAGLGACHFLEAVRSNSEEDMGKAWYCAHEAANQILIKDLPGITAGEQSGEVTRASLASLVRFAFAFYHVYRPLLEQINSKVFTSYPFFRLHLDKSEMQLPEFRDHVAVLSEFCRRILLWAGQIDFEHLEGDLSLKVELFDGKEFFKLGGDVPLQLRFDDKHCLMKEDIQVLSQIFSKLWPERREAKSLKEILEQISLSRKDSRGHRAQLATFVARLYEATKVVVKTA